MAYTRLGELLTGAGLITGEQLQRALEVQKTGHKRLEEILVDEGIVSEQRLLETLEAQLGIDLIDLSKLRIPVELAQLLPRSIAQKYTVVPVAVNGDELVLAMADPLNFAAIEDVRSATRKRVTPRIAAASAVDRAIAALYGSENAARAIEEMRGASGPRIGRPGPRGEGPDGELQAAPTVRLVNSVIERAVLERASDIHLEPRAAELAVRMRVDGLLRPVLTVPGDLQSSVIARLKVMGGMDVSERRVPQDGRAAVTVNGRDIDLRISTLPTIYGEKTVIRLLDKSVLLPDARAIGLEGEDLERYNALLRGDHGMILIVGPTGSGKSSTMYTMIRSLNTDQVNLVTLEDPVEYDIEGVNQVQINEKTGMTFAGGLRAILRQDPDIIAIGEIRDGETAEIAMRSAITGHLVLSTIHTSDAVSALERLADIGVERYMMAEALNGIITQRLVRRICPACREAYLPGGEELARLGMESAPGLKFYRGRGCAGCGHTGYRGRTAAFEILTLDRALRSAIAAGRHREGLLEAAAAKGCSTLSDAVRRLVLGGVTTAGEALRVIRATAEA